MHEAWDPHEDDPAAKIMRGMNRQAFANLIIGSDSPSEKIVGNQACSAGYPGDNRPKAGDLGALHRKLRSRIYDGTPHQLSEGSRSYPRYSKDQGLMSAANEDGTCNGLIFI